jgi:signal recognition particle subunit SRP54
MFASNGEKLEDFDVFHPDRMASRILGMGDLLSLIEQAEKTFDAEQAAKMVDRMREGTGELTLEDFLHQMEQVRKLGSISRLLGMLPGMGEMREQINSIDEREVDRIAAIIKSMTPAERDNPRMLNGSRRARIARGSGVAVNEVNSLVNRFYDAQKLMRQAARGGLPGMPAMPGMRPMPGFGSGGAKRGGKKGKKGRSRGARSGNPAKRALEQRAVAAEASGQALAGSPTAFELPKELKDLLPKDD